MVFIYCFKHYFRKQKKKQTQQYDKILKHLPISEHGFKCAPGWEFSSGKIPQNLHSSHSEILVTPGVNQDFVTDFSVGRVSPLNPNNWQPRKYLLVLKKRINLYCQHFLLLSSDLPFVSEIFILAHQITLLSNPS